MNDFRKCLLAGALLGNLVLIPQAACASLAAEDPDTLIEEVLVTGTRIQRANLGSPSPVVEVSADDLSHGGSDRLEDLLRALPRVYTDQNRNTANGSTGTATLDLRNLGPQRTLVLVDGRRLPGGSPLSAGVADINQIPAALVKRVEVLSGGASATYGSDAVAGVVNFLLLDDFEGLGLEAQFSQYRHRNEDDGLEQLLDNSGFELPDSRVRDGDSHQIALLAGRNFAEDAGNITPYATWRESDAVIQADRIHSACTLQQRGNNRRCFSSSTIGEGRFTDFGLLAADFGLPPIDVLVQGNSFLPYDGRSYNFASLNHFQRPDRRWTPGLLGREGKLGQSWRYEVQGQFGKVTLRDSTANYLLVSRMRKALDVTRDPNSGEPFCVARHDGSDPDCVPWNILTEGAVTPESITYLGAPLIARGRTSQTAGIDRARHYPRRRISRGDPSLRPGSAVGASNRNIHAASDY